MSLPCLRCHYVLPDDLGGAGQTKTIHPYDCFGLPDVLENSRNDAGFRWPGVRKTYARMILVDGAGKIISDSAVLSPHQHRKNIHPYE
jgi:hypothetical protein